MSKNTISKADIGLWVDASAHSADTLNKRTIEAAETFGFTLGDPHPCKHRTENFVLPAYWASYLFNGDASGLENEETRACDAFLKSHALPDPVEVGESYFSSHCDAPGQLAGEMALYTFLFMDEENEDYSQELSDLADEALDYLNGLDLPAYCSFYFEDNSLFLAPSIESAREDVGFVSGRDEDYPAEDYVGEWLHVNDHGNATLYVRDAAGCDLEIWSIV